MSKQKPYVSMLSNGQYSVLDENGEAAFTTGNKEYAFYYFRRKLWKKKRSKISKVNLDKTMPDGIFRYMSKSGKEIKDFYEGHDVNPEDGLVFYNDNVVGSWSFEHDSRLGSYVSKIINNKEFHDHYHNEKDIIKACNL